MKGIKKRLPRKEKKSLIKEGGKHHYWVMLSNSCGSVSTEHVPFSYSNGQFHWGMPTDLYLKKFKLEKKHCKIVDNGQDKI